MEKLSASLEDYIEVIYNSIKYNESVKAVDIARELNVSRASVTEALNKLSDKGLINYGRYQTIKITDMGIKIAEDVTPELILDKLTLANCAKVFCSEAQESAIAAIAQNVAQIGESGGNALQDALGSFQDMLSTKIVNAEYYVM